MKIVKILAVATLIKKAIKILAMAMLLMMAAACLTSCSNHNEANGTGISQSIDLAVVYGCHANAPAPALSAATVADAIYNSAASYGSVTIIVNDGAPHAVASYDIAAPEQNLSNTKRTEIAKTQANQILSVLSSAQADTPEVDTLGAVSLAARSLEGAQGERVILVLDSGLSTCGYMDFDQNLLAADPQTVVDYLGQTKALPKLSGISVVWMGLGDVCGSQQPLTPSTLETLKELWTRVLNEAGASSVTFASDLPGQSAKEGLPYVTPVKIMGDAPIDVAFDLTEPFVLDQTKIPFLPDSAEFADADAAAECLRPIAEHLAGQHDLKVVLAGSTATAGSNESCKTLSRQRAETVRDLLMELGAPEDSFEAILGLGYEHEFHIFDLDPDGTLNANASKNRAVILLDASCPKAQNLLASFQ